MLIISMTRPSASPRNPHARPFLHVHKHSNDTRRRPIVSTVTVPFIPVSPYATRSANPKRKSNAKPRHLRHKADELQYAQNPPFLLQLTIYAFSGDASARCRARPQLNAGQYAAAAHRSLLFGLLALFPIATAFSQSPVPLSICSPRRQG